MAIRVHDHKILNAAEVIAQREGQAAEPTGMARNGRIAPDHAVVCLVTEHGLKDPHVKSMISGLGIEPPGQLVFVRLACHRLLKCMVTKTPLVRVVLPACPLQHLRNGQSRG